MFVLLWALLLHANTNVNYHNELNKILKTHSRATSYKEWKLNNYYPKKHLKKLYEKSISTHSENKYCTSLLQLSNVNTYFLESFFEKEKNISKNCFTKIQQKISNYRSYKQHRLNNYIQLKYSQTEHKMKTHKLFIDPTGGPRLFDGGLKHNEFLLTFDDGPHPRVTPRILKTLKDNQLLAQFFIVGERIEYWPETIKLAHQQGHIIGNHSWTHPDMRKLSDHQAFAQISDTFEAIKSLIPNNEPFFRFPYGAYNQSHLKYLARHNVVSFFWNIDTYDWKIKDPEDLLKYSIEQIEKNPSGIILMHDIHNQTADMLPYLLDYLNSRSAQTIVFQSK